MKKYSMLLSSLAAIALVSCGGNTPEPKPTEKFDVVFNANGGYFNDNPELTTLKVEGVKSGDVPVAPTNIKRDSEGALKYVFAGWNEQIMPVTEAGKEYKATWVETTVTHKVTIDAGDGYIFPSGNQTITIDAYDGEPLYMALRNAPKPAPITPDDTRFAYFEYTDGITAIKDETMVLDNINNITAEYIDTSKDIKTLTWEEIPQIALTGEPVIWFKVGDEKNVNINNKDHAVRIIDMYHDTLASGGKAGITFEFENIITEKLSNVHVEQKWDDTDNYDFPNSELNVAFNEGGSIFDLLIGTAMKPYIRNTVKYVGVNKSKNPEADYELVSYETKLFPLSYYEITATEPSVGNDVVDGEGTIYSFYSNEVQSDLIKEAVGEQDQNNHYWLRSPNISWGCERQIFYVKTDGSIDLSTDPLQSYGVAPAFCF